MMFSRIAGVRPPQAANPHGFCRNSPAINRWAGRRVESARLMGKIYKLVSLRLENLPFSTLIAPRQRPGHKCRGYFYEAPLGWLSSRVKRLINCYYAPSRRFDRLNKVFQRNPSASSGQRLRDVLCKASC